MLIKRLIGVFLFLLLCVYQLAAQSLPTQQNVIKPVPKQELATTTSPTNTGEYQKSPKNHKSTTNKPITIGQEPKSKVENNTAKSCQDYEAENLKVQRQLSESTKIIADFTKALFVVGGLQVLIFLVQILLLLGTLNATKIAANAARDSAAALPAIERAYLLVKVFMDKAHDINIGPDEEAAPNDRVEVTIINVGKTAALLTGITYTIAIFDNTREVDKYLSEVIANYSVIPSGTDIIEEIGERLLPTLFYMTHSKWKELMLKSKILVCLGCIHYEDVFGNPHRTVFCWNYETYVGFHADKDPERNKRT